MTDTAGDKHSPAGREATAVQSRCRGCLLPRTLKTVDFDAQNTCQFCREHDSSAELTAQSSSVPGAIDAEIEQIRELGRGRPYDALVGLSGGRDSSYLAYLLVRKDKLRVLATYYRTPFTQETTDANVRRIVQRLDIPLVEMSVSWDTHVEFARAYFLRWCKDPRPEYAALSCAGCKFLNRNVFQIARQQRIRSIVFGGNPFENIPFLPASRGVTSKQDVHSFRVQLSRMTQVFAKGLRMFLRCPPRLLPMSFKASLLYLNPHTPYLRLRYPGIKRLDYFYYWPWSESECLETIQTHLGWEKGPSEVETWKADCDFAAVKNYMFYKMYGATYNDAFYSNLVRAGQMTRDEAIRRIRAGAGLSLECMERSMQKLRLPMDLIDRTAVETAREV